MMDFIGKLSGFVGKNLTYIVFLVVIWAYFMPNAFLWAVPHTVLLLGVAIPAAVGAAIHQVTGSTLAGIFARHMDAHETKEKAKAQAETLMEAVPGSH